MTKINVDEVAVGGFRSIQEAGLRINNVGLTSVTGNNLDRFDSNGAAKSSIPWAITWGLYGRTPGNIRGDDVIKWTEDKAVVILEGNVDGDEFELCRSKVRNKNALLSFRFRGTEYTGPPKDVQPFVDQIFGTYQLFINSVVFGQSVTKFHAASGEEKKRLFAEVVGLGRYKTAKKNALADLKKVSTDVILAERERDQLTSMIDDFERTLDVSEELQEGEIRWKKATSEFDSAAENLFDVIRSLEIFKSHMSVYADRHGTQEEVEEKYKAASDRLYLETKKFAEWSEKVSSLKNTLNEFGRVSNKCPTCYQTVSKSHVSSTKKSFSSYIKSAEAEKPPSPDNSNRSHLNNIITAWKALKRKVSSIERNVETLTGIVDSKRDVANNIKEELDRINKRSKEAKKKISGMRKKLELANKSVDAATHRQSVMAYVNRALSDSGIPVLLMDELVPTLNERSAHYCQRIFPGATVSFDTEDEKGKSGFDFSAKDNEGTPYELMSDGEKARIDLCVAMAIQASTPGFGSISYNFRWYDEVFESLDESGIQGVIDLLYEEIKGIGSIFVITHRPSLRNVFRSQVEMVKENGISCLTQTIG